MGILGKIFTWWDGATIGTLLLAEAGTVAAHTHNHHVPGRDLGTSLHLVLRDRERVDFRPPPETWISQASNRCAQRKDNLGVLEATGTLIVDRREAFDAMREWTSAAISAQVHAMTSAVAPARRCGGDGLRAGPGRLVPVGEVRA